MSASGRRKPVQSTRYLSSNLFHFIGGVTEKYKHRVHDLSVSGQEKALRKIQDSAVILKNPVST